MQIGIAQINTTVGDLSGNSRLIIEAYRSLVNDGAQIVVFPELTLSGYPPRDLLFKSRFGADIQEALYRITSEVIDQVPAVIGYPEIRTRANSGRAYNNAAAWCESGEIRAIARKSLLPSYDVFDEDRYFEPASSPLIHNWNGKRIGITICEDIWIPSFAPDKRRYQKDPIEALKNEGLELLVNLSASPWHACKPQKREQLVLEAGERCNCPVVYCNAVGGNDELIFDGSSMVSCPERGIIGGLASFRSDLSIIDISEKLYAPKFADSYNLVGNAATHDALVLGLRDYALKSGFTKALIGLSGGIDSAVVCALAVESFGAENVIGVALPSAISSQHSRDDAAKLADTLSIIYHEVSIENTVTASEEALATLFKANTRDVTEENIQARARGLLLMAISNKFGALLLTTGNKSEISVGYCTLYGDMCGGLAVISDLPKMKVYALAKYINREKEIIPINTINKAPSAELSLNQVDEDSLPAYPILDGILELYVEEGLSRDEIAQKGYDRSIVNDIVRKVDLNEYKRKQAPPGLKITELAFGAGRRIPIVQKYVN
ncbi:MAG: NAD+ synthase [Puniceicoccaceae bacterium]|nr:NAD+ synthase [Puniceicoccaceae bacterium]